MAVSKVIMFAITTILIMIISPFPNVSQEGATSNPITSSVPLASAPCGPSASAESAKINLDAAIKSAQASSALSKESLKFQNVTYSSAFQIDKWNSPTECVSQSSVFNLVFSAVNSSRYLGNIVVSEDPQDLSVIGVFEQLNPHQAATISGLAVDGSAHNGCGHNTNSCSATLTTSNSYDIIVVYTTETLDLQTSCTFSVSDTASLTWTARSAVVFGNGGRDQLQEFWAKSTYALSSDTVTESISGCASTQYGGEYNGLMVLGVSGANFYFPFDPNTSLPQTAANNGYGTSLQVSTTNPNDMIISGLQHNGAGCPSPTAGSGFTAIISTGCAASEDEVVYSPQTNFQVTFGDSASGAWEQIGDAIQAPVLGTPAYSRNYAGYEVYTNTNQNGIVPEVFTNFYQPIPSYPTGGCADFFTCNLVTWAGLQDSWNQADGKLAQAGTWADCVNSGCSPTYFAWYGALGGSPSFARCQGSNNVVIHGGDRIFTYTENQAAYGGPNSKYDFEVYDYQSNTSCVSLGNTLSMTNPSFADFITENGKECFTDCATLAQFGATHFFSAQLYAGLNPSVDTFIYSYTIQGFYYQFDMTNAPCTSNCIVFGSNKTCGTFITNVSAGAVDPSSSFDTNWSSSSYTSSYNAANC